MAMTAAGFQTGHLCDHEHFIGLAMLEIGACQNQHSRECQVSHCAHGVPAQSSKMPPGNALCRAYHAASTAASAFDISLPA